MISRLSLVLIILLWPLTSEAKVFNAETFTLENGLQVVLVENHRAPIVTSMVWYKVGGADDPQGQSGLAHMFEHMMFKGSEHVAPGEFSKRVRALGGEDNAFTSYDYTAYYQSVAAEHLDEMLKMEADRMTNLLLPADQFTSEQKVVMEERRQRTDNDPRSAFYEQMNYSLFPHHPYGVPLIGWMNEIAALSREQAFSFYKTWYAPNNAVLVVSGDVTLDTLKEMAQRHFGSLVPNAALPEMRVRPDLADFKGDYLIRYTNPRIRQPVWSAMRRVPSLRDDREGGLALSLLEEILSGGSTTRLYTALVKEQELASQAGMSVTNDTYGPGRVTFYATPRDGTDLAAVEKAFMGVLEKVIQEGVTETELSEAKDRIQASAVFARDSVSGPAMIIGRALASGFTLDDVENWPDDVARITAQQVQDAAAKYLAAVPADGMSVTGHLLPEPLVAKPDAEVTNAP